MPGESANLSLLRDRPSRGRRKAVLCVVAGIGLCLVVAVWFGWRLKTGALRARRTPPNWERALAHTLVDFSVPAEAKRQKNPLDNRSDGPEAFAGRQLYQKNCAACHGSDGSGETEAGRGLYPPPFDLRTLSSPHTRRTDGEIFYFIRNGIRNTGMPGWPYSDREIWQIVSYLRGLPITAAAAANGAPTAPAKAAAQYVGSAACAKCHGEIYAHWAKTPMANVVRDPRVHPEAILPDLSKSDPLVTFTRDDIAFVYGSVWKQRYFKKVGHDYFALPAQWDVTHQKWRPYLPTDDWWTAYYPADNFRRPTGALCDGCHSVGYNLQTKTVAEWNVGCEKCHGPGSEHVREPKSSNVLNAARLAYVPANDLCISCHSQGRPSHNPIGDQYFDWPVGYEIGKNLDDFWTLEAHKLGDTTFTHFADGTAHKNRMQGNDFVSSRMYAKGVTCFTCHDAHGTSYPANLRKAPEALCLDCHGPASVNGPRGQTVEEHTHHQPGSAGSECVACHMPKIEQTIADVKVRSHTFRFVPPVATERDGVPNACNTCHTDKSTAWATSALTGWSELSPWRSGK